MLEVRRPGVNVSKVPLELRREGAAASDGKSQKPFPAPEISYRKELKGDFFEQQGPGGRRVLGGDAGEATGDLDVTSRSPRTC